MAFYKKSLIAFARFSYIVYFYCLFVYLFKSID